MASDLSFVEYIVEHIENAGVIRYRKMFGEYALYCDDKVVALICDNQFFIKPTEIGKKLIGEPTEAPPYEGSKPYYLIGDQIEDTQWFSQLIRESAAVLHLPKKRKPSKKKNK